MTTDGDPLDALLDVSGDNSTDDNPNVLQVWWSVVSQVSDVVRSNFPNGYSRLKDCRLHDTPYPEPFTNM